MASSSRAHNIQSNPPFSLSSPPMSLGYGRRISLLPSSSSYSHYLNYLGISYSQPKLGIRAPNSPSHFRVFSLRGPKVVTGKSWEKLVLNSEVPILVEFYASSCGPCSMVHRVIDEIATEYAGRIHCFMLHADNELRIADDYDIKAVPVVLLLRMLEWKNGEKRESVVGTMPKEFYVAAIERVTAS